MRLAVLQLFVLAEMVNCIGAYRLELNRHGSGSLRGVRPFLCQTDA